MDLNKLNINKIRTEVWTCRILADQRCLWKACEWAEDLIFALPEESEEKVIQKLEKDYYDTRYNANYEHAKACFDLNEYDRCAHFLRDEVDDSKSVFLHFFSRYKAAEKKRVDLMGEVSNNLAPKAAKKFIDLRDSLERFMEHHEPDGWLLYVYGLILHKFRLFKHALTIFELSINKTPSNWSAWFMLTLIVDNKDQLHSLNLPNHLFKVLFYFMMRYELNMSNEEPWVLLPMKETNQFIEKHFKKSLFIKTIYARSLGYASQPGNPKEAIELFKEIRRIDPYRLDGIEIYSNLLYVTANYKELSRLAYEVEKVNPFTTETNCCIANSYSARTQHDKAIMYFTRALRLNPDHCTSWTLIGHEYLETKNIDKAVQAYRSAISINKRDCRAWLGLGNTYETVLSGTKDPNYAPCLYYFSQVRKYRPNDHIMWLAMSGIYEKMGCSREAIECTIRAGKDGLDRLAKLYEFACMMDSD